MEHRQNPRTNPRQNTYYPKFPRAEPPIFNKNESNIDELYTKFLGSDYEDIINIIQSGKNLNFRNSSGNTLIHAVINNETSSLTEILKLEIIQKLLDVGVSINAMDKLNRNALHYASIKNYPNINYENFSLEDITHIIIPFSNEEQEAYNKLLELKNILDNYINDVSNCDEIIYEDINTKNEFKQLLDETNNMIKSIRHFIL